MYQNTREIVANLIFELREGRKIKREVLESFKEDSFTRFIFNEEKQKIEIEEYLDGHMTQVEAESFEKKLYLDSEVAQETKFRSKINTAIKEIELFQALDAVHSEFINEKTRVLPNLSQPKGKTQIFNGEYILRWAVAACILLFIGLSLDHYYSNRLPINERLYAEYYAPFSPFESENHHFVFDRNGMTEAEEEYLKGNYQNALAILNNLPNEISIQAEKQFYIGMSDMEIGNFDAAIRNFNDVLNKNVQFKYVPQINWYLGLCYLNIDETNKAVEIFQHVVKYKGYKYQEAKKILKKLE